MTSNSRLLIGFVLTACSLASIQAADWPQFMGNSRHTGDACEETLSETLHCVACIALEDAVLTSPAVVADRAYVVDQMGTAYCIDLEKQTIVWKTTPEVPAGFGSNTSSPCVMGGRVFFGTIAGKLHILNCSDGSVVRSVPVDWPILDAITGAGQSIYFQPLNGAVYCLDLEGNTRWTWDPYHLTRHRELEDGRHPRTDGSSTAYFAGNPVAVAGDLVVTAVADDLVCLRDKGTEAELVWKVREPAGSVYTMFGPSIVGDWVYVPAPGKDGKGAVLRVALKDGALQKDRDVLLDQWASLNSAAVRDQTLYFGRSAFGVTAYDFDKRAHRWTTIGSQGGAAASASLCSGTIPRGLLFHDIRGRVRHRAFAEGGGGITGNKHVRVSLAHPERKAHISVARHRGRTRTVRLR